MNQQGIHEPLLEQMPYSPIQYDKSPEDDIRSFSTDLNTLQQKSESYHIKALVASLIVWLGIPAFILLGVLKIINVEIWAIAAICAGIYLIYLALALCCNPLHDYLKNMQHGSRFNNQYERIKGLNGHFIFHAECFHYETRYHSRNVSDGRGGTRRQTHTTREKVVTHVSSQPLYPEATRDDSGNVEDVKAMTLIIFIRYLINYRFVDAASRQIFDYYWYNFKIRNRFDAHQNYHYIYAVPGLIQRMTFFISDQKPQWKGYLMFWGFLGLIWPYSMWIESKISRYNISFLKILKIK